MAALVHERHDCRLCGSERVDGVFSLAATPPANAFLSQQEVTSLHGQGEEAFPLDLLLCLDCGHLQLQHVVNPERLFGEYKYVSGTSPVFVEHFRRYVSEVHGRLGHRVGPKVLEVGSNDGTMLRFFQQQGYQCLGVDPARDIAKQASAAGLETLPEFFTETLAQELRATRGDCDVVIANNVFAHIDDLHDIARAVRTALRPDGLFVFEVSYLKDVLTKTLFDTIYHEHLSYHAVRPLVRFFARHGLQLIDATLVDSHGGSIRVYVQHEGGGRAVAPGVAELIRQEERLGLFAAETFQTFAARIDGLKHETRQLLQDLRRAGKKIAGFGAPAKATTLMHHFALGADIIDFIVDDSPLKQGLLTPGLHIPVLPSQSLSTLRPDYVVILAWNFASSIIAKHQAYQQQGGRFVVPLPELTVI